MNPVDEMMLTIGKTVQEMTESNRNLNTKMFELGVG